MKKEIHYNFRIVVLLVLVVFRIETSKAQISTIFQQSNIYSFGLDEAINCQVLNSGQESIMASIDIEVKKNALSMYACKWDNQVLETGLTQLQKPLGIKEIFSSQARLEGLDISREFSPGNYLLCIKITNVKSQEILNSECFKIEILPMSPLVLIYPSNESVISYPNPDLIWQGPFTQNINYTYTIKLCERYEGQSTLLAIGQNPVLFGRSGLNSNQITYPIEAKPLELGHTYVWQVDALSKNSPNIKSEVWAFTYEIDSNEDKNPVFFEGYLVPKIGTTEGLLNIKKQIQLSFEESNPLPILKLSFLDAKQNFVMDVEEKSIRSLGFNKYQIDLEEIKELKNKKIYYLKIVNPQTADSYLIKFKYYK
jgi:hypothetical protein